MSDQDVEIVRRAFAEFQEGMASGNPAASLDSGVTSSDFRWTVPVNAPGMRPVYVGREGWLEFIQTWTEDFDWAIDLEEAIDIGDGRVLVNSRQRAAGKTSGVPVELVMGSIYTVEGGEVVAAENFLDPAEAREAAGLSD